MIFFRPLYFGGGVSLVVLASAGAVRAQDSAAVPHGAATSMRGDSVLATAPVSSVSDLLAGHIAGVQVTPMSGLAGAGDFIRIRGQNSLTFQDDPIIVVDGIRTDNSAGGTYTNGFPGSGLAPGRLDDLAVGDIQSITVLHGPASAAEYGTGAANGVVLITTKRGDAGGPHWSLSAEQGVSDIPVSFPNVSYSWGHTTDGTSALTECSLLPSVRGAGDGSCVADSVQSWNPLNSSPYSILGPGSVGQYHLSVDGGPASVRYFIGGGLSNEGGLLRLPGVFQAQAAALGLPSSAIASNSEQQGSARATISATVFHTFSLSATGAYLSTREAIPLDAAELYSELETGESSRDSAGNYGYGYLSPLTTFSEPSTQRIDRVTGGLTAQWRPATGMTVHATWGVDRDRQRNDATSIPAGVDPDPLSYESMQIGSGTVTIVSTDVGASATAHVTRVIEATTTAGFQLTDQIISGYYVESATTTLVKTEAEELPGRTTGEYVEEQLGFVNRAFVSGVLRVDDDDDQGEHLGVNAYPAVRASWLAVNGSATTLRLRAAFGEAGSVPAGAYPEVLAESINLFGGGGVGRLHPETVSEDEGGADFGLWRDRVTLGLTAYSRTTHDAFVPISPDISTGGGTDLWQGPMVRNTGLEGDLTAILVRESAVTWDLSLDASVNANQMVSASVPPPLLSWIPLVQDRVGYPLNGYWAPRVQYTDQNRDGIIEPDEVVVDTGMSYMGASLPTRAVTLDTRLSFWRGLLTTAAQWDYRGGFRVADVTAYMAAASGNDLASNNPTAPLLQQANDIAIQKDDGIIPAGFYEDGTFVRFRELSLTYALPRRLASWAHLSVLSLTGAIRNLALWTRYSGPDPEVSTPVPTTGAVNIVNHDWRADDATVPLARYWVLRLNMGF